MTRDSCLPKCCLTLQRNSSIRRMRLIHFHQKGVNNIWPSWTEWVKGLRQWDHSVKKKKWCFDDSYFFLSLSCEALLRQVSVPLHSFSSPKIFPRAFCFCFFPSLLSTTQGISRLAEDSDHRLPMWCVWGHGSSVLPPLVIVRIAPFGWCSSTIVQEAAILK